MKTLKIFTAALLIASAMITVSCDDDGENAPVAVNIAYQQENPLPGFLHETRFEQDQYLYLHTSNGFNEIGMSFKPTVKGNINSILVKMPAINHNVRVTIWDKATHTPLRTEYVDVAKVDTVAVLDITPLELTKDTEYAITMNTADWYFRRNFMAEAMSFPVVSGSIMITSVGHHDGTDQVMPAFTTASSSYYDGDVSFYFQQKQ